MVFYNTTGSTGEGILPLSKGTMSSETSSLQSESVALNSQHNPNSHGTFFMYTKELLLSLGVLLLGMYAPVHLREIFLGGVNMRPIPFQILSTGDVVLDLSLNQEWIQSVTVPCE